MRGRIKAHVNPRARDLEDIAKWDNHEMRKVRESIDSLFRKRESRLFATEGGSSGSPWQALSPDYADWKKKHYPGRKILARTGALRTALTQRGGKHRASFFSKPYPAVVVGAGGEPGRIGSYHVLGEGNLPKRDPIDDSREAVREYMGVWQDEIAKKIDRVWRAMKRGARFGRRGLASTLPGGKA